MAYSLHKISHDEVQPLPTQYLHSIHWKWLKENTYLANSSCSERMTRKLKWDYGHFHFWEVEYCLFPTPPTKYTEKPWKCKFVMSNKYKKTLKGGKRGNCVQALEPNLEIPMGTDFKKPEENSAGKGQLARQKTWTTTTRLQLNTTENMMAALRHPQQTLSGLPRLVPVETTW